MNSEDMIFTKSDPASSKPQNSDILKDLDQKLSHLDPVQRRELKQLIHQYEHLFPDIPTRTDKIYHDVNVEDSQPVKQHSYIMKKKGKRKVQGVPQSQTASLPRPQEEEETDKSKQAQIEQTYEKH